MPPRCKMAVYSAFNLEEPGGSSTKSFRPEAKKEGGWVKTILEKSPFTAFIEKYFRHFLGVSYLFLTRYVRNFYYHVH